MDKHELEKHVEQMFEAARLDAVEKMKRAEQVRTDARAGGRSTLFSIAERTAAAEAEEEFARKLEHAYRRGYCEGAEAVCCALRPRAPETALDDEQCGAWVRALYRWRDAIGAVAGWRKGSSEQRPDYTDFMTEKQRASWSAWQAVQRLIGSKQ